VKCIPGVCASISARVISGETFLSVRIRFARMLLIVSPNPKPEESFETFSESYKLSSNLYNRSFSTSSIPILTDKEKQSIKKEI
jgi:hypothetical protein